MSAYVQIIHVLKSNVLEISAVIFFVSIVIVAISAMLVNKKKEDRETFAKQIIALALAAFIIISAASISGKLNSIIEKMTGNTYGSSEQASDIIEIEDQGERGFWQKGIDAILGYFAEAAEIAKKYLVGTSESLGIRGVLHKAVKNPLADFNVPTKSGGTVNLYTLILSGTSFLTFLMVINTAYKIMKYSWNPSKREEVINAFSKWGYIIIIIASFPAVFAGTIKIMDILMGTFSVIELDYLMNAKEGLLSEYAFVWSILRLVMAYVEFKIFVLMIYRTFVINAYYLTTPIAIYLWGISDNFTAANGWINGILINIFSPLAYEISFILSIVVIKVFYPGNVIASVILMFISLTVGDVIRAVVTYKMTGNVLGSAQDVSNMTRGLFGTMMTVAMVSRAGKGILNNKVFKSPGTKIPPTTGGTFSGREKTENNSNQNAYNKAETKADQLGKTTMNNSNVQGQKTKTDVSNPVNSSSSQNSNQRVNTSNRPINRRVNRGNTTQNLKTSTGQLGRTYRPEPAKRHNVMRRSNQNVINSNTQGQRIRTNVANPSNQNSSPKSNTNNMMTDRQEIRDNIKQSPISSTEKLGIANINSNSQVEKKKEQNPISIKDGIAKAGRGIKAAAKGAPLAVGIGTTISTGNPVLGYAASKGTQLALNATQNIVTGGTNAVKQTAKAAKTATDITKSTVQRLNKAIKSNSDFKAHRRN